MGIELDSEKNKSEQREKFINTENSQVNILVVPTNEELLIVRDTLEVVSGLHTGKE